MATYKIDPAHSEATFKIRHLMISNVTGHFSKFDGTLTTNKEDFSDAVATFEADVNSITTNQEQRDQHLLSADFFDAANYPKITFQSTSVEKKGDDEFTLHGNLTIRGNTKPVTLNVIYNGSMKDFYGQDKLGFEITGKINRKDFGLTWNAVTEAGGVVVSDDVRLAFNVQLAKQA